MKYYYLTSIGSQEIPYQFVIWEIEPEDGGKYIATNKIKDDTNWVHKGWSVIPMQRELIKSSKELIKRVFKGPE